MKARIVAFLRWYPVAIPNGMIIAIGWLTGVLCHRLVDGWRLARVHLDRLDDRIAKDLDADEARRRPKP